MRIVRPSWRNAMSLSALRSLAPSDPHREETAQTVRRLLLSAPFLLIALLMTCSPTPVQAATIGWTSEVVAQSGTPNAADILGPPSTSTVTFMSNSATYGTFTDNANYDTAALAAALGVSPAVLASADLVVFEQNAVATLGFEGSVITVDDGTTSDVITHVLGDFSPPAPILVNGFMTAATFNAVFGTAIGGHVGVLVFDLDLVGVDAFDSDLTVTITRRPTGNCSGNCPDVLGLGVLSASSGGLNHFQCYDVARTKFDRFPVDLVDDFGPSVTEVRRPRLLCAPVNKYDEDPTAPHDADHLIGYQTRRTSVRFERVVEEVVTDQFGSLVLDLQRPERILVPSAKSVSGPASPLDPPVVDHYQCYKVRGDRRRVQDVEVEDQFTQDPPDLTDVKKPLRLCLPVDKNGEGIIDNAARLMCYQTKPGPRVNQEVWFDNQFGGGILEVRRARELCVPVATPTPTATPHPGDDCPCLGAAPGVPTTTAALLLDAMDFDTDHPSANIFARCDTLPHETSYDAERAPGGNFTRWTSQEADDGLGGRACFLRRSDDGSNAFVISLPLTAFEEAACAAMVQAIQVANPLGACPP